jgi:hypothetical protein
MNAVTILEPVPAGALTLTEADLAHGFALDAKAPATRRAYREGFAHFTHWCRARGLQTLPACPETVAGYLAGCGSISSELDHAYNGYTQRNRLILMAMSKLYH